MLFYLDFCALWGQLSPNFLDAAIHKFKELHAALDNLGDQLRSECISAEVKHASIISTEEEEALWKQEILGCDTKSCILPRW